MDITLESLNELSYEQAACFNVIICSFVATHQCQLQEAELMDDALIGIYRDNVEHLTPDSVKTDLMKSTSTIAWNLLQTAGDNLMAGRNTGFCQMVVSAFTDAWKKALV